MRTDKLVAVAVLPLVAAAGLAGAAQAQDLTAAEIIARVDANAHVESAYFHATMTIRAGRRELVKELEAWVEGENGLVSFLNPADRGTKYLKLGDELWLYFPDADDLVKLSGHMLRQGMMGSDFSYEDALESQRLQELYEVRLAGTEACGGSTCYVLEATARPGAEVTYAQRRLWVDRELFVVRRQELRAAGGRLLKVSRVEEIRAVGGRPFPTRTTMEDVLRGNSSTTLVLDHMELDVEVPPGTFTLRSLMR